MGILSRRSTVSNPLGTLLLLLVSLVAVSAVSRFEVKAETSVKRVYLYPEISRFESGERGVGEGFSLFPVMIMIEDFTEVHGWQVQINFNSTLLRAHNVYVPVGSCDYIFRERWWNFSIPKIENPIGGDYVIVGQNLTVNGDWVTDTTHPRLLAEVAFERIKLPPKPSAPDIDSVVSCTLNINNTGTYLLDPSGAPLQSSEWKFDGGYEYKWSQPLGKPFFCVSPPQKTVIRYPPSSADTQFDASIYLEGLDSRAFGSPVQFGSSETVNVSFALTYDPKLLQVVNISEGPFMRNFGSTTFASTNVPGKAIINEVYLNPPWTTFPFGGGEIARIRFNITYQGVYPAVNQSILNITDIVLKDHYGDDIPIDTFATGKWGHATYVIEGLLESEIKVINPLTDTEIFRFYTDTTNVGDRFNVTVVVTTGDLFAYQVYLTYNVTFLNATRAWLPTWDNSTTPWVFFGRASCLPTPVFFTGAVLVGDSVLGGVFPEPTFNGRGKLAIIEFEILSSPRENEVISSVLNITTERTFFLDSSLREIPATLINGLYEYIWFEGILGDLNRDRKVDIKDVVQVALAFGSYPNHPRWNPSADLNHDSRVDIRDIALVAKNFGQTV